MMVLASHFFSGRPLAFAWARAVDDLKPENLTVVADPDRTGGPGGLDRDEGEAAVEA